jgi:hypothetical protein
VSNETPGVIAGMEIIFELLAELFMALDGMTLLADLYAWMKGKNNRIERREARRLGLPPPPRDKWNKWVIVLTVAFVLLTAGMVLWRLGT